ncbi:MAG: Rpn family recombination-promoting nuclease/putative transposase, partial [Pseudomonadota bacterium]|nr:Rpn family recombination-promoting nuclease/putative transposase [Pseudomonadota bacterium]
MSLRALHNALFMAIFNNHAQLATKILKRLLGKERAAKLDFRTLKFDATVFSDAEGNERRADAIISVMRKGGRKVVFLVEHKSSQNKNIFKQL